MSRILTPGKPPLIQSEHWVFQLVTEGGASHTWFFIVVERYSPFKALRTECRSTKYPCVFSTTTEWLTCMLVPLPWILWV